MKRLVAACLIVLGLAVSGTACRDVPNSPETSSTPVPLPF
jgi:hypothetical protein